KSGLLFGVCLWAASCSAQNEKATPSPNVTSAPVGEVLDDADAISCMCVPRDECKDETVERKQKTAPTSKDDLCGPEQVCCSHLIVRTEKTVETHSYYYRNAKNAEAEGVAKAGEFPWQAMNTISRQQQTLFRLQTTEPEKCYQHDVVAMETRMRKAKELVGARCAALECRHRRSGPSPALRGVVVHPKFRSAYIHNLAVIKLGQEVGTTPMIGRVPLSRPEYALAGKTSCVVSGWGKNLKRGSLYQELRKANVTVLNRTDCLEQLKKTKLGPSFKLDNGSMCAAENTGAAACEGDEGGPMVCRRDGVDRVLLVGIVSYGDLLCGQMGVPAVFADTARNIDFISEASGLPKERFYKS
ncbi:unnamed protein product, partial [Ixodes hexagonus]